MDSAHPPAVLAGEGSVLIPRTGLGGNRCGAARDRLSRDSPESPYCPDSWPPGLRNTTLPAASAAPLLPPQARAESGPSGPEVTGVSRGSEVAPGQRHGLVWVRWSRPTPPAPPRPAGLVTRG